MSFNLFSHRNVAELRALWQKDILNTREKKLMQVALRMGMMTMSAKHTMNFSMYKESVLAAANVKKNR